MSYGFENGEAVPTCEADVYFDERDTVPPEAADAVREILKLIVGSPHPALQAEVLSLLLGVGFRGCTEAEIATRNTCTRAAVSSRMVKIRVLLGLDRPVGPMRAEVTRWRCMRSRIHDALR